MAKINGHFPGNKSTNVLRIIFLVCSNLAEYVPSTATSLDGFDAVMLPGGFSYGDYLRCGAIAALTPIMGAVRQFADSGKPVIGICNGFQILTEAHLLPGVLKKNDNLKFICRPVALQVENNTTPFTTKYVKDEKIHLPIAHSDGNFYADSATIDELEQNHQIVFRYVDHNPNGSVNNIAGICNRRGNVVGMMPHPERASEKIVGNDDGFKVFQSLLALKH